MPDESLQRFGGDWTEQKLRVLQEYLTAYITALKDQPFKLAYIDAFAGTGYRHSRLDVDGEDFLFESLAEEEPQKFPDGSARIALNPHFSPSLRGR